MLVRCLISVSNMVSTHDMSTYDVIPSKAEAALRRPEHCEGTTAAPRPFTSFRAASKRPSPRSEQHALHEDQRLFEPRNCAGIAPPFARSALEGKLRSFAALRMTEINLRISNFAEQLLSPLLTVFETEPWRR